MVEFDFLVSDVKKVDTANHLLTLEIKMSMEWLDGRLSCWSQVRPGICNATGQSTHTPWTNYFPTMTALAAAEWAMFNILCWK